MDPLSTLCVLLGTLIIAGRAPMVFAPAAALQFNKKLLSTDARTRGFAVVLTPLATAAIALPLGEGAHPAIARCTALEFPLRRGFSPSGPQPGEPGYVRRTTDRR